MMGWLLFRSTDMQMAAHWYAAIFGLRGVEADYGMSLIPVLGFVVTIVALLFCWFAPNTWNYRPRLSLGTAVILGILLVVCILRFDADSPFLYFQF
jgi:catechol 2,3-dioxygenase-like lactoylglutathione lyase family enzyme